MTSKRGMSGWTVYDHPSDYPNAFVARRWLTDGPAVTLTNEMFTADTLQELRALLPAGLHCIPRFEGDQPQIVEVWL